MSGHFDPGKMLVWTSTPPRVLRSDDLEDQFRQLFDALVFELEDGDDYPDVCPDPGEAVARAEWQVLRYDVLVNSGEHPIVFADDTAADLGYLSQLLLDDYGALKEELQSELGEPGLGSALLYIDRIDVSPGHDVFAVAVDVMEHIIRHYSAGCFGAVYFRGVDERPDISIERALRFLGFKKVGQEPIYFVNLEHKRPDLPDYEQNPRAGRDRQ